MKTENDTNKDKKLNTNTIPVVLIRHAQSLWNKENRFTGWANPPLTDVGVAEAINAGKWLQMHGYRFDIAYSSRLQRAISTMDILLNELKQTSITVYQDWRLNERHYGRLQGINKAKAAAKVGEHQIWRWRRGYEDMAEPMPHSDPGYPAHDPIYADLEPELLPNVENLAQTRARVVEFWNEQVTPRVKKNERILISTHGNTLRALLMELAEMSIEEVEGFEIPTATPIEYHFDTNAKPIGWHYLAEINQHSYPANTS